MNSSKQLKNLVIGFDEHGERIFEATKKFANSNGFLDYHPEEAGVYTQLAAELFVILMEDMLHWNNQNLGFKRIQELVIETLWLERFTKSQYRLFESKVLEDILDEMNEMLIWLLKDRKWHRFEIIHRRYKRYTHSLVLKDLGDHRILLYHENNKNPRPKALFDVDEIEGDESSFDLINAYITAMQGPN